MSLTGGPVAEPPTPPKPTSAYRHPLIVGGGLVTVAVVVLAVLLSRGGGKPTPAPSSQSSSSPSPGSSTAATGTLLRIDPATNVAAQAYAVGKDPTAVAIGEGSVWVANAGDNSILRLDPATGKVQASTMVDQQPRGIAIGGGVPGVWVNTLDRVWKIDPLSNDVVLTHDLGDPTGAVATGEGSVWVTGLLSGLGKVDPATGLLDPDFSVGKILCSSCGAVAGGPWSGDHQRGAPPSVAAGLGSVWAVGAPPPTGEAPVWRIDPSTGSSAPIQVPFGAVGVAVGQNAVWAVGTNGEVARIDPETNKVVRGIETGNGATQVAAGLGSVWILNPTQGTVTRIDPGTNAVIATIDVGAGTTAIAAGEGSVWVTGTEGS